MSNGDQPSAPFERLRKSKGDPSRADISDLGRILHAETLPAAGASIVGRSAQLDRATLQDVVDSRSPDRRPHKKSTRLTEEQALALKAYSVVTGQGEAAALRHALVRFIESDEFRATIQGQ